MLSVQPLLTFSLTSVLLAAAILWIVSLVLRDASVVDVFWGLGIMGVTWFYYVAGGPVSIKKAIVLGLVTAWGLRLSLHIALRNRGKGEDFRYAAMRKGAGASFWLTSLFRVFLLQGILLWIVTLPLLWAELGYAPGPLNGLDALGTVLFSIGFLFEAAADWQLSRFRADPDNRDRVFEGGLWRFSRHPNYFGDAMVWWGIYCFALGTPGGAWTIVSPLLMTLLLMRVSGVKLLEKTLLKTKPDYRHYTDKTSAFFPWFPK